MTKLHILWKCCLLVFIPIPASAFLEKAFRSFGESALGSNQSQCSSAVLNILQAAEKKELWALKYATAKFSSGQLLANPAYFGEYDECLAATDPHGKFIGQYCLANGNYSKIENEMEFLADVGQDVSIFQTAFCLPSLCSNIFIEEHLNNIFKNVMHFKIPDYNCMTRESTLPLTKLDYSFYIICAVLVLLGIISTIYECYQRFHENNDRPDLLYSSFSLYTNGKSLVKVEEVGQYGCLHGLKGLSMFAIIYGHTAMEYLIGNISNRAFMMMDVPSWRWTTFNNAHSITDTFFVMGAMLLVVTFFRDMKTKGGYDYPLAVIKRYLRLTPNYALLLLFTMTVKKYFIFGPSYPVTLETHTNTCYENWYWCLSYLQNYMSPVRKCLGHSWYLDVDMQLFWLSPILLYPVLWCPTIAAIIPLLIAIGVASYEFSLGLQYDLAPVVTFAKTFSHLRFDHYFLHTRSAPWFLGIFLGFIFCKIVSQGKNFKLSKTSLWLCWIICGAIFIFCQFPLMFFGFDYQQPMSSLCLAYRRLGWALGVGWIIIACTTNYGGPLNKFLCWGPFSYFSKISYNVYLIHLPLIEIVYTQARESEYASVNEVLSSFLLFSVLSVLIANLMCLFVEIPCSKLVSIFFRNTKILPFPNKKKPTQAKENHAEAEKKV